MTEKSVTNKIQSKIRPVLMTILILAILLSIPQIIFMINTTPKYRSVQDYKGTMNTSFFLAKGADYAIGATENGTPVFKDPRKAVLAAIRDCPEGIEYLKNQGIMNQPLYMVHHTLPGPIGNGPSEEEKQAVFISQFLDIYENSFNPQ